MLAVAQRNRLGAAAVLAVLLTPAVAATGAFAQPAAGAELLGATVDRYCLTCHNDRLRTAGLSLADQDLSAVAGHAELWEKVIAKLRTRAMPPVGRPRPAVETYDRVAGWLEAEIDRVALAAPTPGAPRPCTA